MVNSLVLIGGGGHCRSCIDVIESSGQFNITGILDFKENVGNEISGYDIIGTDEDYEKYIKKGNLFLITIGQIKSSAKRNYIFDRIKKLGGSFGIIVSSKAYVSKTSLLNEGTIVMHGVIINSNVRIGVNNILNTGSIVEHDVRTGDHCHISTRAVLNGESSIGNDVFIGSNAVVSNSVSIHDKIIIGAGTVVHKNILNSGTYAGNPFRKINE